MRPETKNAGGTEEERKKLINSVWVKLYFNQYTNRVVIPQHRYYMRECVTRK